MTITPRFKLGFIYGSHPVPHRKLKSAVDYEKSGKWLVLHTPIENYGNTDLPLVRHFDNGRVKEDISHTKVLSVNVANLIEQLVEQGHRKKEKPRILDVGIGSGFQWKAYAKEREFKLGRDFELQGTSLTNSKVIPDLSHLVRRVAANAIHKMYPQNSFDLVVCHYGAHSQIKQLIESAHRILKPGGHLIISGVKRNTGAEFVMGHSDLVESEIPPLPPHGAAYYDKIEEYNLGHWNEGGSGVALHYVKKAA